MAFKQIKIRKQKLKPIWHTFNCLDCGVRIREYSDPRVSLYLCIDCQHKRQGIVISESSHYHQVAEPVDWWTLFCLEYESKKASGQLV